MQCWYFAYGSNLWIDQMIQRTGELGRGADRPRVAQLADHRLVFQQLGGVGPAYANILSPGDGVLGAIYRCSAAAMNALDQHERGYERAAVTVVDSHGELVAATAYIIRSAEGTKFGAPSAEYLQKIVTGARQHGLPEKYIGQIVAIAAAGNPAAGLSFS